MRSVKSGKSIRVLAAAIGAIVFIAALFSALYIVAEADHECCGEDCHICAAVRQCGQILREAFSWTLMTAAVFMAVFFSVFLSFFCRVFIARWTPVSFKVRLNN